MRLFLHRFPAIGGLLLFALLCAVALAGPQYFRGAATLIVTTTADSGPGSLRAALAASDGNTIQFDPALNGQTISLSSGELAINKSITIRGPGVNLLAVSRSGASQFRIFHALSGHTVVVEGLTITGGDIHNNQFGCGGGILNDGATSTINNCTISGNRGFDGAAFVATTAV
jgi:nitrous oxidase accessory protein NosD